MLLQLFHVNAKHNRHKKTSTPPLSVLLQMGAIPSAESLVAMAVISPDAIISDYVYIYYVTSQLATCLVLEPWAYHLDAPDVITTITLNEHAVAVQGNGYIFLILKGL